VCYNCNQPGNLVRDCTDPCTMCKYCHATNHVIEECPQLMAKMQERRQPTNQPNTQNIFVERRTDEPQVQAVTQSGIATGDDRGKATAIGAPWVRRDGKKQPPFDLIKERETFIEAR